MVETLIEVLRQHQWDIDLRGCTCRDQGTKIGDDAAMAEHQAAAVAAAGLAVVELPDQMADRDGVAVMLQSLPMWLAGDAWTCLREPDLIEFEADSQNAYGELPVTAAEHLAAALLAAAGHAESAVFSE